MARESETRSVLVSRFSALGDVAMALPAVYDACAANPDVRFVMLTRNHPATIFINRPENLVVEGVDLDEYKGIGGIWRLASTLYGRYGFNTYVDLHDVLRTKLLRLFLRLRGVHVSRIRKGRRGKSALTRRRNKVLLPLPPTPQRYREAFRRAGIPRAERFRSLFGDTTAPADTFAPIPQKEAGERWIAVAPFARHAGKIYPLSQMGEVVDAFASRPGVRIFLFGAGDRERQELDIMAKGRMNVVNMAELRIGIPAELALLSHCDVMVSMDSANMHLASLVGLRVVSVWGATHPYCGFLGWRQSDDDTVQLDMVCRPCSVFGNKPCFRGDYHCLRGISPQRIIDKVDAVLPNP